MKQLTQIRDYFSLQIIVNGSLWSFKKKRNFKEC